MTRAPSTRILHDGSAPNRLPAALATRTGAFVACWLHRVHQRAHPTVAPPVVLILPLELAWVLLLRSRVARLERHRLPQLLAMRTRYTPAQRKESLTRVLTAVAALHCDSSQPAMLSIDRFLSGWHFGVDVSAVDAVSLRRWLAGILFYVASPDELSSEERVELDEAVAAVAAARGSSGEGAAARSCASMRVCVPSEPLNWFHFPLLVYVSLAAIRIVGRIVLSLAGFTHHAVRAGTYYHRAATAASGRRPPLVLLPGVGVGVGGYFPLLTSTMSEDDSELILLELPQVTAGTLLGFPPTEAEVAASVLAILAAHSHSRARFLCHSFGTFVMAWLLHEPSGRAAVHSLILVDPVALLIAFPHTTHGAVYRRLLEPPLAEATRAGGAHQSRLAAVLRGARLLRRLGVTLYFMREPHIALVLQRNVHWPSYSLWLEDVPVDCRVTVALSTDDAIVPTREVASYCASCQGLRVQVLWLQAHEHGAVIYNSSHWGALSVALQDDE